MKQSVVEQRPKSDIERSPDARFFEKSGIYAKVKFSIKVYCVDLAVIN
ncbi:hypothetical protein IQ244_05515 [Nostoc sp. LEGE 06077]|nr:hypothetical protein [Nostoc sp. LEGE 06077]MBE9205977.1 hypothetical protein [Nostoc sp. LEGE 06077]